MKRFLKISIFVILLLAVVAVVFYIFWGRGEKLEPDTPLTIGEKEIMVRLADEDRERARGLIGYRPLSYDQGMLFVYEGGYFAPSFHMRGMSFPIDIIWIKDGVVVGFDKNLPPNKADDLSAPVYPSKGFINYVLEVSAGFVELYDIKMGDEVLIGGI